MGHAINIETLKYHMPIESKYTLKWLEKWTSNQIHPVIARYMIKSRC